MLKTDHVNELKEILIADRVHKIEEGKLYNCLKESKSSQFYAELFSDSFQGKAKPELYDKVKAEGEQKGSAYRIMNRLVDFLKGELSADAIVIEIGGGVHQKRSGDAYARFKNYYPLDISYSSISRYTTTFNKTGFVADAQVLPFKDGTVDCIFTHTFLEHPIHPDKVLEEIVRVLKPGGIVIHNDAWFCRWWHTYGIVGLKRFSSMALSEKLIWLAAKITEIPFLRIPPIILRRLYAEVFTSKNIKVPLRYRKLKPNYELHLGCDEDAASRIDPMDVVRFYESRDFSLIEPLSFLQRIFYGNKPIALRKTP
jgi:ubiquinone/menaquinone biosynthesis C-methylase UbiE